MLRDIKNLLAQRKEISLRDLATHFNTPPQAIEPIMEKLCRKGLAEKIIHQAPDSPCSKCKGCSAANTGTTIYYRWLGESA